MRGTYRNIFFFLELVDICRTLRFFLRVTPVGPEKSCWDPLSGPKNGILIKTNRDGIARARKGNARSASAGRTLWPLKHSGNRRKHPETQRSHENARNWHKNYTKTHKSTQLLPTNTSRTFWMRSATHTNSPRPHTQKNHDFQQNITFFAHLYKKMHRKCTKKHFRNFILSDF